ncbi:Protein of unknown function [Thermosyntropha lipolytica DSM 11003]|uniref:DUF2905 domain-containing protein n=1 Tax=Thermosyntropha lipolytica DSM 11003 TaxID=1123382 RepID=A0A1M5P9P6_9FIRM|nr:DUF2905 family protein [Thermosyntropha lipolytica]SHG98472.1 Protein of unknown function [Thermosyntropha lipolytica DSM 11003]
MNFMESMGKIFISLGFFLLLLGVIFLFLSKLGNNIPLFRLPGDIYIKRENFAFYFPLTTFLLLSLFLTLIANLILRR